jgi:hypothetical protein
MASSIAGRKRYAREVCGRGEIGNRAGFRCPCSKELEGSSPSARTDDWAVFALVKASFHAPTMPNGRDLGTDWAHFKSRATANDVTDMNHVQRRRCAWAGASPQPLAWRIGERLGDPERDRAHVRNPSSRRCSSSTLACIPYVVSTCGHSSRTSVCEID